MKYLIPSLSILAACIVAIISAGCSFDQPKYDETVPLDIEIIRFDQILQSFETQEQLDTWCGFHVDFCSIYFREITHLPKRDQSGSPHFDSLQVFLSDPFIKHLTDTVEVEFPDLGMFNLELGLALGRAKKDLELDSLLRVYTFVSGLAYQRFLFSVEGRDALGIGLDLFLGDTYPYHLIAPNNPSFSSYNVRTFNREHMARKCMELLVDDRLPLLSDQRMLDLMIQNGIRFYTLKQFLPETHDTIIYEFSYPQLQWCRENELQMWSFFLDEELLYERDLRKISKYVMPSPYSPGMPDAAPGQTANYLGSRIIESYVQRHPEESLHQLFAWSQNAQKLLEDSNFKPTR